MCGAVNLDGAIIDLSGRDITSMVTFIPQAVTSKMHFIRLLEGYR
jgi:hypothetical protein